MDRYIVECGAHADDDLMICPAEGVAYQADMSARVGYDEAYFNKCLSYEDQAIAMAINRGRIELVARHVDPGEAVLDIGVGSGEFIKKRPNTFGYDINPVAEAWLRKERLWSFPIAGFPGYTFWDVIEHVEEPEEYFEVIRPGAFLFTSVPLFADLSRIRESRHYRPGEHLYYWTEAGFVAWMARHGFDLAEHADFEIAAGRDSIHSFAFQKRA